MNAAIAVAALVAGLMILVGYDIGKTAKPTPAQQSAADGEPQRTCLGGAHALFAPPAP
jgi:hypothetical protein